MNARERFRGVMGYGAVDRVPWLEEGLRDDVFERWTQEGMPAEGPSALFTYDRRERIEIDLGLRHPGRKGLFHPAELPEWRRNLDRPLEGRLGPHWPDRVARWQTREHILELPLHSGLFLTLGVGDWASLEEMMYLLADEPAAIREALELQGQLVTRMVERVCREVDLDFLSVSEPIGGNSGPLVGPAMYEDLVLRTYRPALDLARTAGVNTAVFMTYANARCLLPVVLAAGFNCLWAMETETTAMDYAALRREFGRGLRFIGGIDLDALLAGPSAIEHEMRSKVPALLQAGGFIPLADGRVRVTVSWPAYTHYRKTLEDLTR